MKSPKNTNLYSRLALITSITLITGYLIVSATWTSMSRVGTGDQLSATLWNTFVDNLNDLDTRLKSTASTWPTVTGGIAYTGGNVGIGTVSPAYPLSIVGGSGTSLKMSISNLTPTTGHSYTLNSSSDGKFYLSDDTATTNRFMVNSVGNVGIGTIDPGGYRTAIRGSDDTSGTGALWVSGLTAGTPGLMVRNDGNVGIGTATPGAKLEVIGGGDDIIKTTRLGITRFVVKSAVNSVGINTDIVNNALTVNGGADFSGNVGIGTTSPAVALHVFSNTSGDIARFDRSSDVDGIIRDFIRFQRTALTVGGIKTSNDTTLLYGLNNLVFGINEVEKVRIDVNGNVGIGTASPGNYKLKVDGGPFGVAHGQNTNTPLQIIGKDAASAATYLAMMASGNGADNEFLFQSDGTAKADGTWNGGGADYAEWFEKEGEITGGALIGLNTETGKVRTWREGDTFIGIQSLNPGFVGNNIHGAETKEIDMVKTHVLVALVGQVEVKSEDIIEQGRRIMTSDGQFIGLRLANGNVFIK